MRFRSILPAILGLALLIPATPTLAGGPQPTASVNVMVNSCELSGLADLVTTDTLIIKHRSASGALRAKHTVVVAGEGAWEIGCPGPRVRRGDKLQFIRQGSSTPFRTFTVPMLTLRTDRANDRVSGKAPGAATVDLIVVLCDTTGHACTGFTVDGVPVNAGSRAWSYASTDDLRGGSRVSVIWQKGADEVVLEQGFAQVVVRPGSALVTGTGRSAGRGVAVTQRRGDTFAFANPVTRPDASFTSTFRKNGTKRPVKAGDLITSSVAADATFTVPQTSMTAIVGGVEGTCAKNRAVSVLYTTLAGEVQFVYLRTTDSVGHWEVLDDLEPDTIVEAWCATKAGDAIVRQIVER